MIPLPATRREWIAAGALVVGAVVFLGFAVARLLVDGGGGWARADLLTLPFALLGADLVIAAALLTGWYPVRPVAQGLAIFGTLVYVLVLLRSGPWWMRTWSGLLTVAHVYGLVLLFALSSREHQEAELAEEEPVVAPVAVEAGTSAWEAAAPAERPVTAVEPMPAAEEPAASVASIEDVSSEEGPAGQERADDEPAVPGPTPPDGAADDPAPPEQVDEAPAEEPPVPEPVAEEPPVPEPEAEDVPEEPANPEEPPAEPASVDEQHTEDDDPTEPDEPAETAEHTVTTANARPTGGREEEA